MPNGAAANHVLDTPSRHGVATTSATIAWAAGQNGKGDTLILHWNGKSWK